MIEKRTLIKIGEIELIGGRLTADILYYRASGSYIYAIVSGEISKSVYSEMENVQTIGQVVKKQMNITFNEQETLMEFLEDHELDYEFFPRRIDN